MEQNQNSENIKLQIPTSSAWSRKKRNRILTHNNNNMNRDLTKSKKRGNTTFYLTHHQSNSTRIINDAPHKENAQLEREKPKKRGKTRNPCDRLQSPTAILILHLETAPSKTHSGFTEKETLKKWNVSCSL